MDWSQRLLRRQHVVMKREPHPLPGARVSFSAQALIRWVTLDGTPSVPQCLYPSNGDSNICSAYFPGLLYSSNEIMNIKVFANYKALYTFKLFWVCYGIWSGPTGYWDLVGILAQSSRLSRIFIKAKFAKQSYIHAALSLFIAILPNCQPYSWDLGMCQG